MVASHARPRAASAPPDRPGNAKGDLTFRADVEGLRGFAMVLMLLFHAGVPLAAGGFVGLDVFFVISGFLITSLLAAELERTGTIALGRFYGRRAKRLLPLATTVLLVVAVGAVLLFPPTRRVETGEDVLAAGLYVVNWLLHAEAVDYFAEGQAASPVQHYWSLSVEEQFYLVWPLILIGAARLAVARSRDPRRTMLRVVLGLGALSLAYCVHRAATHIDPGYFSTFTRSWEFALGAAIALGVAAPRGVTTRGAALLGGVGLCAIVAAFLLLDDGSRYPGAAALVPALGAGAIVVAGGTGRRTRVRAFLCGPLLCHVGRLSYAWYLWHWPLIVFAAEAFGELSAWQGLAVVAFAYLPAYLTHRLIEEPFRRSQFLGSVPWRGMATGGVCTASASVVAVGLQTLTPAVAVAPEAVTGAAAVAAAPTVREAQAPAVLRIQTSSHGVRPDPLKAKADRAPIVANGCRLERAETEPKPECVFGDRDGTVDVAMVGDSHMAQYFSPIDAVARERGWRLTVFTKASCPPMRVAVHRGGGHYTQCDAFKEKVYAQLRRMRPALVVLTGIPDYRVVLDGRRVSHERSRVFLEDALVADLRALESFGARTAVVEAFDRPTEYMPDCVAESMRRLDRCVSRGNKLKKVPPVYADAARRAGAALLDPRPLLCVDGACPAVIGDAIVYRQTGHLTDTFARTLTPWMRTALPRP